MPNVIIIDVLDKEVQSKYFPKEISALRQNYPLSSKSKILKLNPMIDKFGLLRLNGRLKNAHISFDERFPIILPKNSHYSSDIYSDISASYIEARV